VLVGVADATILPFIPLLLRERGFGSADIGLLLAGMALAGFATGPLWGYAADLRVGSEVVLAATCAAAGCVSVLVFFAQDWTLLVFAVIALWACRSSNASLADAIALDRLGEERRAEYGRVRLWTSIGWAAAVLVWGAVIETSTYGTAALLYPAALVGVVAWTLLGLGGRSVGIRRTERLPLRLVVRPLLVFLAALFLAQTAFAAGFNFSSLRIAGLGGSAFLVGVAASVQAWAEVPAMAWMTRLRGVAAARHFYVAGCGVYAAVLLFWAAATDPTSVALARLVLGVGFALTYVGSVVVVDELVPGRFRATGQVAAKSVTFGLAPVAGALGGGLVYGHLSPRAMFLAAGVFAVVAGLVASQASASRPATYHSSSGSKMA
jgi:PPP family 3-phenylpropionic acid transporter